jgi:FAS-associated factor 2
MNPDSLLPQQKAALAQFQELTSGTDEVAAANILSSAGWDVQRAVELIFDTGSESHANMRETFEVDDSEQGRELSGSNEPRANVHVNTSLLGSVFSALAYPFHLLSNLLRFLLGVLRIPFPQVGQFSYRLLRPGSALPRRIDTPERWVRELEEETGAVCLSSARTREARATGIDVGPSSATVSFRPQALHEETSYLPDFVTLSYEAFLKKCIDDIRIGCVVLVSEEHDDTAEFKRTTLTDRNLVDCLASNDILVWGGDVRSKEAYGASEKLQATTYPFVAFVALQAKRSVQSHTSVNSSPVLTILSRHQGRDGLTPSPITASALVNHIQHQVLPRVSPYLERLRVARRERERDRVLREDQDRAFRETRERDKQRIEAKILAEQTEKQAQHERETQERFLQRRREQEEADRTVRRTHRIQRRRWTRKSVNLAKSEAKDAIRIAFSFPGSGRIIHYFPPEATLTELFAFVDVHLIPAEYSSVDAPTFPPDDHPSDDLDLERRLRTMESAPDEWFGYRLLLAYPRQEIQWQPNHKLRELDSIKGGGHIVVELHADDMNLDQEGDTSD